MPWLLGGVLWLEPLKPYRPQNSKALFSRLLFLLLRGAGASDRALYFWSQIHSTLSLSGGKNEERDYEPSDDKAFFHQGISLAQCGEGGGDPGGVRVLRLRF